MSDKDPWALDEIVVHLTRFGFSWSPAAAYFSFPLASPDDQQSNPRWDSFSPAGEELQQGFRAVFANLAEIANITFNELPDNGTSADRLTLAHWSNPGSQGTPTRRTGDDGEFAVQGEVWIQTSGIYSGSGAFVQGGPTYWLLLHEVGHALGLAHPADYPQDGPANYDRDALYFQDSRQYTVMSYFLPNATGGGDPSGPAPWPTNTFLLHDIAALQSLYGANWETRSDDTVYGFNSSAGVQYGFTADGERKVFSIWDGGGDDTLDLSGFSAPARIDLNEGEFTDAGGLLNNISIAYGAVIENAIGGSGNDMLIGNDIGNALIGGAGDDTIFGGNGDDVLTGGDGADRFLFEKGPASGIDTIHDFDLDRDLIVLAESFAALLPGGLSPGSFVIGASARDSDDRIIYHSDTGALLYDSDGIGGAQAVQFAAIGAGIDLSAEHFFRSGGYVAQPSGARLILLPGESVFIGGNVSVIGTTGPGEEVAVTGGDIVLDASFARGGDTLILSGNASDYGAHLNGSRAILFSIDGSVSVPIGTAGLSVQFDDGALSLVYDVDEGVATIGDQILTEEAFALADAAAPGLANSFVTPDSSQGWA